MRRKYVRDYSDPFERNLLGVLALAPRRLPRLRAREALMDGWVSN